MSTKRNTIVRKPKEKEILEYVPGRICGFCVKAEQQPIGLVAVIKEGDLELFRHLRVINKDKNEFHCPLDLTLDPKSEKAAINVIKNGGRMQMCMRNKWRYMRISIAETILNK